MSVDRIENLVCLRNLVFASCISREHVFVISLSTDILLLVVLIAAEQSSCHFVLAMPLPFQIWSCCRQRRLWYTVQCRAQN